MKRSDALMELSEITARKEELHNELAEVMKREVELYAYLKLPMPDTKQKPPRKRMTKESVLNIRRVVSAITKRLVSKGIIWVPISIIVKMANEELPNAEDGEIEGQIRMLSKHPSSPITHNNHRGPSSAYSYQMGEGVVEDVEGTVESAEKTVEDAKNLMGG